VVLKKMLVEAHNFAWCALGESSQLAKKFLEVVAEYESFDVGHAKAISAGHVCFAIRHSSYQEVTTAHSHPPLELEVDADISGWTRVQMNCCGDQMGVLN